MPIELIMPFPCYIVTANYFKHEKWNVACTQHSKFEEAKNKVFCMTLLQCTSISLLKPAIKHDLHKPCLCIKIRLPFIKSFFEGLS